MKVSFEFKARWYSGEPWRLLQVSLFELWNEFVHDTAIMIIDITILKLGIALWINFDRTAEWKGYIQEIK